MVREASGPCSSSFSSLWTTSKAELGIEIAGPRRGEDLDQLFGNSAIYINSMVLVSLSGSEKTYQLDEVISKNLSEDHLRIFVQVTEIDPLKGEAITRILPWPNEVSMGFTFRSGWPPN